MGVCVCVSVRYVAQYIQDGCAIFRRGCWVCPAVLWSETAVSISILHVLCCCCFVVGSRCWRRMCARGRHCAAPCVRASAVLSGCAMCVGLCGGVVVCVVACRCGRVRVFAVVIKAFRWCQVCWLCLLIEIYWGRRGPRDHLGGFLGLFEVAPQFVLSRPMPSELAHVGCQNWCFGDPYRRQNWCLGDPYRRQNGVLSTHISARIGLLATHIGARMVSWRPI